jgi:hypothetical protein
MTRYVMTTRRGQVISVTGDCFTVRLEGQPRPRRLSARDRKGNLVAVASGDPIEIRFELDGLGRERMMRSVKVGRTDLL